MDQKQTLTHALMSIDELIEAVSLELRRLELDALPDRRASLLPDVRMVRYYTTLGLLKPPRIVQRQAQYGSEHFEALLLVKLLQIQGLSLARIQQELIGLSPAQRQSWLEQLRRQGQTPPMPQIVTWQEVILEPGLRLQFRGDYTCTNLEAVLRQVKALFGGPEQASPPGAPSVQAAPEQASPSPGHMHDIETNI